MRQLKISLLLVPMIALITSCGGGTANADATADGFAQIEADLKSEFGDIAYYTDLVITPDETIGNIINTTVTDDPASLQMGEWVFSRGAWTQNAEVSLEIPEGTKAADFMFVLGDQISLKKLGSLIEQSKESLTKEKNIDNPRLSTAMINFPDNGDIASAAYVVMLEPENGGTSFTYTYTIDGKLDSMNY